MIAYWLDQSALFTEYIPNVHVWIGCCRNAHFVHVIHHNTVVYINRSHGQRHRGHVQSENGVHRFATVFGLNGTFPLIGVRRRGLSSCFTAMGVILSIFQNPMHALIGIFFLKLELIMKNAHTKWPRSLPHSIHDTRYFIIMEECE